MRNNDENKLRTTISEKHKNQKKFVKKDFSDISVGLIIEHNEILEEKKGNLLWFSILYKN